MIKTNRRVETRLYDLHVFMEKHSAKHAKTNRMFDACRYSPVVEKSSAKRRKASRREGIRRTHYSKPLSLKKACPAFCRNAIPNLLSSRLVVAGSCPIFCPQALPTRRSAHLSVRKACRRDGPHNLLFRRIAVEVPCPTFRPRVAVEMLAQLSVSKASCGDGLLIFLSAELAVEMACLSFCPQGLPSI